MGGVSSQLKLYQSPSTAITIADVNKKEELPSVGCAFRLSITPGSRLRDIYLTRTTLQILGKLELFVPRPFLELSKRSS